MRSVHDWFASYSADHRNPTNRAIHWVCVPVIMWAVIAALWTIPPILPQWFQPGLWAVLAMFAAQSAQLIGRLADLPEDAPSLAHTLKGSARAIGAFAVADAAARLEAVLSDGDDPSNQLSELCEAVAVARTAIEAVLRRS